MKLKLSIMPSAAIAALTLAEGITSAIEDTGIKGTGIKDMGMWEFQL